MFRLSKISQTATFTPDLTVKDYEERLNREGFTGGYTPVGRDKLTWDDCLSERIPNFHFLKYGGVEELCLGGKVVYPSGEEFTIIPYPRSATGPDLRRVVIGSKKIIGTFSQVTLKIFPLPQAKLWGLAFADTSDPLFKLLRNMIAEFIRPSLLSFYGEEGAGGLSESLKLPEKDKMLLAFQLNGLKSMVEVEKEVVSKMGNDSLLFHWISNKKEIQILEDLSLRAEKFEEIYIKSAPLLGDPRGRGDKFENRLASFFKENPC